MGWSKESACYVSLFISILWHTEYSREPWNLLHLIHDNTRRHSAAYKATCLSPLPGYVSKWIMMGSTKNRKLLRKKGDFGFWNSAYIANPLPFPFTQVTLQSSVHTMSAPTKNLTFSQVFVKDGSTVSASAAVQLCECESELAGLTAGGQGLELSRCQFKCHGSIRTWTPRSLLCHRLT